MNRFSNICQKLFDLMNSIEAYEKDIELQLDFLKLFRKQRPLSQNQQKNTLFSGSGDSLISAMLAESFSNELGNSHGSFGLVQK